MVILPVHNKPTSTFRRLTSRRPGLAPACAVCRGLRDRRPQSQLAQPRHHSPAPCAAATTSAPVGPAGRHHRASAPRAALPLPPLPSGAPPSCSCCVFHAGSSAHVAADPPGPARRCPAPAVPSACAAPARSLQLHRPAPSVRAQPRALPQLRLYLCDAALLLLCTAASQSCYAVVRHASRRNIREQRPERQRMCEGEDKIA
jgi:hypothetical protein